MDEIFERKKLERAIKRDLEEIEYIRNNYVFEEKLTFEQLKEIDSIVSNLWLKYHYLIPKKF